MIVMPSGAAQEFLFSVRVQMRSDNNLKEDMGRISCDVLFILFFLMRENNWFIFSFFKKTKKTKSVWAPTKGNLKISNATELWDLS